MSKDDGGPAFPVTEFCADEDRGMTLRDYFAGRIISAMIVRDDPIGSDTTIQGFAADAYYQADAMLVERKRNEG